MASEAEFKSYAARAPLVYVQELLDMDRDLRVVVVGDRVVCAYWRMGSGFHNNLARGGRILREQIPQFAVQKTLEIARQLNIDYAGFDLALTPAGIYILEFNPWFGTGGLPCHTADLGRIIQAWLEGQVPGRPGKSIA